MSVPPSNESALRGAVSANSEPARPSAHPSAQRSAQAPARAAAPVQVSSKPVARSFEVEATRRADYRVHVGAGLLDRAGELLVDTVGHTSCFVLTDERVADLYGTRLTAALGAAGLEARTLVIRPGEGSKTIEQHTRLLHALAASGCQRRSVLVAFGGGVVSDLTGYVASSYMRGIRYVNVSTTLLGQVDASVGGKVAVDLPEAKNLIGAFHHPSLVVSDTDVLATLPRRELCAGIAEVIKVAILGSPALFDLLETEGEALLSGDATRLAEVVFEGARLKMDWIARDPYERDLRRPLNLGHTLGHPIESSLGYHGILHGEAVAIGTGAAIELARARGAIDPQTADRVLALLAAYDLLGTHFTLDDEAVVDCVAHVRRIRGGALHFVLPLGIGRVQIVEDVPDAELRAALGSFRARAAAWEAA